MPSPDDRAAAVHAVARAGTHALHETEANDEAIRARSKEVAEEVTTLNDSQIMGNVDVRSRANTDAA